MNNIQAIKELYEKYHILDKESNEIEKKILEALDKIINLEEENKQCQIFTTQRVKKIGEFLIQETPVKHGFKGNSTILNFTNSVKFK